MRNATTARMMPRAALRASCRRRCEVLLRLLVSPTNGIEDDAWSESALESSTSACAKLERLGARRSTASRLRRNEVAL